MPPTAPHFPHRLVEGLSKVVKALDPSTGVQTAFTKRLSELKSKGNVVSMLLVRNRGLGAICMRGLLEGEMR